MKEQRLYRVVSYVVAESPRVAAELVSRYGSPEHDMLAEAATAEMVKADSWDNLLPVHDPVDGERTCSQIIAAQVAS